MKLNLVWLIGRSNLAIPLQTRDCIDERRMHPGFKRSLALRGGDNVSRRLFHYAEPIELQLTEDRCFPRARRASEDESSLTLRDYDAFSCA